MNESFDQQAAHRPAPSTGSRQAAHSCGSATSTTSRSVARAAAATRAQRRAGDSAASISPCMGRTVAPSAARLNGGCGVIGRSPAARSGDKARPGRHIPGMPPAPPIFDRRLLRARGARAAKLGASTFLIERVAEDFADRLAVVLRRFECAVDLGTPTDALRRVLAASGKVATVVAADALIDTRSGARAGPLAVAADEEALPFRDGSLDLVVSALAMQFVNDLPGTLVQIRRALKPDGLLLAALAGGDTLTELRQSFAAAEAEIEDGISP